MSPTSILVAAVAVFVFVVGPGAAGAQTGGPRQPANPRETARLRFGPIYLTPAFEAEVGYDSNVFNESVDPKGDATAALSPRADVWLPIGRRGQISTSATADFIYFQTIDSEQSIDPTYGARGELFSRHATFFGDYTYLRSRQRPNFEIDTRSERTLTTTTAGATVSISSRLSAEVNGFLRTEVWDKGEEVDGINLADALDHDEQGAQLTVRQVLTSFTTLFGTFEGQRDRFQRSPERNSDSIRATGGFEFNPRALLAGRLEIGVRDFATGNPDVPDFTGVVAQTELAYTWRDRTQFSVTWHRDIEYSYQPTQPYDVSGSVGLEIRRQLRGSFEASFGADRTSYDYQSIASAEPQADRTDVTMSYTAGGAYRLSPSLSLALDVELFDRNSPTDSTRNYRATRGGLSVVYSPSN